MTALSLLWSTAAPAWAENTAASGDLPEAVIQEKGCCKTFCVFCNSLAFCTCFSGGSYRPAERNT